MTTPIELWDKLRQQPHSWIPDGKVFAFVLTPNERETVLNALRTAQRSVIEDHGLSVAWNRHTKRWNVQDCMYRELVQAEHLDDAVQGLLAKVTRCAKCQATSVRDALLHFCKAVDGTCELRSPSQSVPPK